MIYLFDITFENTTNGITKTNNGLQFYGRTEADNEQDARTNAELVANSLYEDIFKDAVNNIKGIRNTSVHGLCNRPRYTLSLRPFELLDTLNGHNLNLVKIVNYIFNHEEYHNFLHFILKAIYERDYVELSDYYSDECVWWEAATSTFEEMLEKVGFESLAYELLYHVGDDADLEMVVRYIRPTINGKRWYELV